MVKAIFIAILVATSMAYSQVLAQEEEINPSPEQIVAVPGAAYDNELLHRMTTKRFRFLQDCSKKLSYNCDFELATRLVNDKPMSEGCCTEILKMGRDCHEGVMSFVLSTYGPKDVANKYFPRSKQMWNQCVQSIAARFSAPFAFET